MVNIIITPAHSGEDGNLTATGHAGNDLLCNTITAICECLAANLDKCWDVRLRRRAKPGNYELTWNKDKLNSRGLDRANRAAGFAYNGLQALEEAYPQALHVQWNRVMEGKERDGGRRLPRRPSASSQ